MNDSLWAIRCAWLRYFAVYRKNLRYALTTTFAEPLLYLFSFGFGMGALIKTVSVDSVTVAYRPFVLSGLVGQTVLFQAFFDGAYGGYIRMYYQRIFKAMATTPMTLAEVLWAELLWGATKATLSVSAVLVLGVILGDFATVPALLLVPVCFVSGLLFAGLGLTVAAISDTIESISYPQYLLVFPMFLFCGVYFPVEQLPDLAQWITRCLPLTPLLELVRAILLGFPLPASSIPALLAWTALFVWLAHHKMAARLVK